MLGRWRTSIVRPSVKGCDWCGSSSSSSPGSPTRFSPHRSRSRSERSRRTPTYARHLDPVAAVGVNFTRSSRFPRPFPAFWVWLFACSFARSVACVLACRTRPLRPDRMVFGRERAACADEHSSAASLSRYLPQWHARTPVRAHARTHARAHARTHARAQARTRALPEEGRGRIWSRGVEHLRFSRYTTSA